MAEIEIGADKYQVSKLMAKDAFHVVRRIAPLLKGLGEGFSSLSSSSLDKATDQLTDEESLTVFGPLMDVLSEMEDSQLNYVIDKCLAKVQIQVPDGRWASVMPSPGRFLFEDKMDMGTMFQLVVAVLQESNVLSFFTGAPALLSTPGASR